MWTTGLIGRTIAAMAVIGLVAPATAGAQAPSTVAAVRPGTFIYMVADAQRTMAFYTTLLGVQPPEQGRNPTWTPTDPAAAPMYNARGRRLRGTGFTVPNANLGLLFLEWEPHPPPAVQQHVFDPGAVTLVLQVRNIQAGIEAVTQHGGSFVTPGGQPVRDGNRRVLIIRDPDGSFIELINMDQPPPAREPGNVIGATFRYTAVDANRTARFFKDAFGFTVTEVRDFTDDAVLGKAMGLSTLSQRWAGSLAPDTNLAVQFAEYDSKLGGQKIDHGLPRPGTAMLRLSVRDFDDSLAKARAAGATLAPGNDTSSLVPTLGASRRLVVLVSPDGLLLQLYETPE